VIPVLFYLPGTCAFGSIVTLEWLELPFRLCRLDGESLNSFAYRRLNPLSQVPTFKSGEGVITESAAILQHLGFLGLNKKIAYAQGTADFDRLNQIMSFLTTGLHTSMSPIVHPDRAADSTLSQTDVVHKSKTETVPARLRHIEKIFERHEWLCGFNPTIADAYFYGVARKARDFINLEKDFPKISEFFERFGQDPGVQFALAIEGGQPTHSKGGFKGDVALNLVS
jgi:glutathione S-transferase